MCIVDDEDPVFIIPLSGYFYSHSPHWLLTPAEDHGGLLCSVSLPMPALIMSHCQGKLAMLPHLGPDIQSLLEPHKRADHYL